MERVCIIIMEKDGFGKGQVVKAKHEVVKVEMVERNCESESET